jgi:hypothetical protein
VARERTWCVSSRYTNRLAILDYSEGVILKAESGKNMPISSSLSDDHLPVLVPRPAAGRVPGWCVRQPWRGLGGRAALGASRRGCLGRGLGAGPPCPPARSLATGSAAASSSHTLPWIRDEEIIGIMISSVITVTVKARSSKDVTKPSSLACLSSSHKRHSYNNVTYRAAQRRS